MKVDSGRLTEVTEEDIGLDGTFVIPAGVTTIGSSAFRDCKGITKLTIPDSVRTIGSGAFRDCKGLTTLTISDGLTMIGSYAFSNCSGLITLTIPDGVTIIGSAAFQDCSSLTTLTIPDGVTTISDSAFFCCSGLTVLTIPDSVTTIGHYAFNGCSGLTTLTIPDNVTAIGGYAFGGCSRLTTLTIPDNVTAIGGYAFYGCNALEHLYVSQAQQDGLERIRDLLPDPLRDKVVAVSPAGRLTKRAGVPSITAGPGHFKKARLFDASEPASPLVTLLQASEKQISAPGQVQLIFKTNADAQAMQNALEQTGVHAGTSAAAQYAIEDIIKADENKAAASAASAAATDLPSGYAIKITKVEYNELMKDESAYDQLSQSANGLQP